MGHVLAHAPYGANAVLVAAAEDDQRGLVSRHGFDDRGARGSAAWRTASRSARLASMPHSTRDRATRSVVVSGAEVVVVLMVLSVRQLEANL